MKTASNTGLVTRSSAVFGDRYRSGYPQIYHSHGIWSEKCLVSEFNSRSRWQFCGPCKMLPDSTCPRSSSAAFKKVKASKNSVSAGDGSRSEVDSSHLTHMDFKSSHLVLSEYVEVNRTECVFTGKNTVSHYKNLMRLPPLVGKHIET